MHNAWSIGHIQCVRDRRNRLQRAKRQTYPVVIPTKAGRSAKRGERPKDGPEGMSEANHLS